MKTVKEHFAALPDADIVEALDLVSYGQYPERMYFLHWPELIKHCEDAVRILGEGPFLGPPTCALIMNMAMKALKKEQGVNAPTPWLPVIKQLHAMSVREPESADDFSKPGLEL